MMRWHARLVIACLILLHSLVNIASPVLMEVFEDGNSFDVFVMGGIYFLFGISVSQLNLITCWAIFGPGSVVSRASWTIFLAVLMWSTFAITNALVWPEGSREELLLIGILMAICLPVLTISYGIAGWALRIRSVSPGDETPYGKPRVTLREFMVGSALVCMALAMGRIAAPDGPLGDIPLTSSEMLHLAMLLVANYALILPGLALAFATNRRWLWFAGGCILAMLASIAEMALVAVIEGATEPEQFAILACFNLGQVVSLSLTLGALRWHGFRLLTWAQWQGEHVVAKIASATPHVFPAEDQPK